MQIPVIIFLYLYLMMMTLFILFSIFLVYHALRFGTATIVNLFTMGLYLAVAAGILISSYIYINGVDWGLMIKLF